MSLGPLGITDFFTRKTQDTLHSTVGQLESLDNPGDTETTMPESCHDDWDCMYNEESGAANEDWNAEYSDELELSQKEGEEQVAVSEQAALSCSDSESGGSSTSCPRLTQWWAQALFQAVRDLGIEWPTQEDRISVASACAGCSAESAVLEAGQRRKAK